MMNSKTISILLSSCIVTNLCSLPVLAKDAQMSKNHLMNLMNSSWGSNYDSVTEFTISSEEDLLTFASMVNSGKDFAGKTVKLVQSIALTGKKWIPIGSADMFSEDYDESNPPIYAFAGIFDGQNYSISNLKLSYGIEESDPLYDYGGLFGYVTGTIKNVELQAIDIVAAYDYFGGIVGYLGKDATIENCSTSGKISGATFDGDMYGSKVGGIVGLSEGNIISCTNRCNIENGLYNVGGIVGRMDKGNIQNCENIGSIEGYGTTGGIVGDVDNSIISNCVNRGEIIGNGSTETDNRRIGGIVGGTTTVEIQNCENTGLINASEVNEVGGIVGYLYYGSKVEGCSNRGAVKGDVSAGGITGYAYSYSQKGYEVKNCQNEAEVSGNTDVGGIVGTTSSADKPNLVLDVSNCKNAGTVSGKTNVGGIVGNHNSSEAIAVDASASSVSGCINTGIVPEGAGVIVGNNNSENDAVKGKVHNNFWPEGLGSNAISSGVGSSNNPSTDVVKNNSSYSSDGTLTQQITDSNGNEINNLGDAIDKIIGGESGTNIPEILKVTVTYENGGHGTAPQAQKVTMGSKVTLSSMSNDGYFTFVGWTSNGHNYSAGAEVSVMEDTTFTAQWRNDTPSTGGGGGGGGSSSGGGSTSGTQFVKHAVYRAYNPNSGEHFYTPNYDEFKFITSIGWHDEGIACMTETKTNGHTLYRLYNPNSGLHHYTLDENEKNVLVSLGWNDEDVAWYTSKKTNDPAVYRLYNPNDGQHHYTMDVKERDALVKLGWTDEGVGYHTSSIKK